MKRKRPWSTVRPIRVPTPEVLLFRRALGQRIREFRERRGITQAKLARMLGFNVNTMQFREVGRRAIPVDDLYLTAQALGVTVRQLIPLEVPGEYDELRR